MMKKLLSIAAVAALCVAPAFGATTMQMRVVTDGDAAAITDDGAGNTYNVFIQAQLGGDATDGLALWGVNLKNTGATAYDLCDGTQFLMEAPAGAPMENFDRNLGLTNPKDIAEATTGYAGTCDGAMGLWQLGGGQNTIANTGPTAFPVGPVSTGVGNSGWVTVAEGTIDVPVGFAGEIVLALDTAFANTLDLGTTPPTPPALVVWPVSEVATADITIAGALTITFGSTTPNFLSLESVGACNLTIADGDTEMRNKASYNFILHFDGPATGNPALLEATTASPTFVASAITASCTPVGNDLDCTFSAPFAGTTTYRLDMAGIAAGDPTTDVRILLGDVNSDGITNGSDRGLIIGHWTGSGFTCDSDLNEDGITDGSDRGLVIGSWTGAVNTAP